MAASSPPPTPADTIHGGTYDSGAGSSSFFRKTVCLFDWWLIKTESAFQGKRLGIAGLTSREQNKALRAFSSSAIAKRFDVFTLETSDGVSIVIKGFINKQRTTDNGFPSEVFNDFVFGFPPNWQKYAESYCTVEDSTAVLGLENPPSTIQSSLEESPKKNLLAIHDDSNKLNPGRVLGGTIQSGRKLDVSEKSPIHLSAKIRSQTKDRPTVVLGLASRYYRLNPLPVVSYPKNNLVQNEVGGGVLLIASGDEFQEPMDANVAQKLGDGSVKDGPHQTSKSKRRRKPKNVNSKAAKETDTEEESTPRKKSKRKIMFEKQVPPHSPEEKAITCKFSPECSTYGQSRSVLGLENPPSTIQSSLEESPKKNGHAIHEDSNKLNPGRVLGGTVQSGRKLDVSEKSPIHLSAKIRSQTRGRPTVVLGLASRYYRLNPLPVVSYPKKNLVQTEVGGGSILIASGNELQEPMDANVAQKLGDGSVKDGPHQTSKSKRRRKSKNMISKAAKETDTEEETDAEEEFDPEEEKETDTVEETDAEEEFDPEEEKETDIVEETDTEEEFDTKEESTPRKKTKRKIMFEKQVPPHSLEEKAITSIFSPECSTFRQSRSGRLLLPTMEFWRNQLPVYDSERNLTGILGDLPVSIAKRKEIRKKQKKVKEYKKYSRSNASSSWSSDEDWS